MLRVVHDLHVVVCAFEALDMHGQRSVADLGAGRRLRTAPCRLARVGRILQIDPARQVEVGTGELVVAPADDGGLCHFGFLRGNWARFVPASDGCCRRIGCGVVTTGNSTSTGRAGAWVGPTDVCASRYGREPTWLVTAPSRTRAVWESGVATSGGLASETVPWSPGTRGSAPRRRLRSRSSPRPVGWRAPGLSEQPSRSRVLAVAHRRVSPLRGPRCPSALRRASTFASSAHTCGGRFATIGLRVTLIFLLRAP